MDGLITSFFLSHDTMRHEIMALFQPFLVISVLYL